MTVGSRIKELREKRGFTQNRLAEWAGVSQTHLRRVELGEADITVGHLTLICDALGISLREFFSIRRKSGYELGNVAPLGKSEKTADRISELALIPRKSNVFFRRLTFK